MSIYYKLIKTALFGLFMGLVTCFAVRSAIDKFGGDWLSTLMLVMFSALMGFVAWLYCRMACMRLRGIPVLELTDDGITVRDAVRKTVVIPYGSIVDLKTNERGIVFVYTDAANARRTRSVNFIMLDIDSSDLYDMADILRSKLG
ncbi:MAG: hypothetical protein NC336_06965 [Clostridium sp.]|nr:hypothetical protein [Clostridium sp.]